jgi:hypothetical protein
MTTMSSNYVWSFHAAGSGLYAAYRDGQFYHNMTSRQIEMDARFHRDHANLMRELKVNGVAKREFLKSSIRQFNPFPV